MRELSLAAGAETSRCRPRRSRGSVCPVPEALLHQSYLKWDRSEYWRSGTAAQDFVCGGPPVEGDGGRRLPHAVGRSMWRSSSGPESFEMVDCGSILEP